MGYHLNVGIVSRGKGQSVMAKAAYNARGNFVEERTGEIKNYTRMDDRPMWSGIFADKTAPAWVQDRQRLWNEADRAEKRKDAQLGLNFIAALPHQLTDQQREYIVKDFAREQFARKHLVADAHIHPPSAEGDQRNYHVHILVASRTIGPDGFGEKFLKWEDYGQQLEQWREKWAERGAKELEKAGFTLEAERWRVGHLDLERQRQSARERGDLAHLETLNHRPTEHRGPQLDAMQRRGIEIERGNIPHDIDQRDRAVLLGEAFAPAANQNTAALKIELAEIQEAMRREERAMTDALLKATQRPTGQQENQWPTLPQQPEHIATSPAHHFADAARATVHDHRPEAAPEQLRGTAAEIWLAVHRSDNAKAFAAALEEDGIELAVVTKDEAERSRKDATAAREKARYAPVYREHEIVAVDDRAFVYRLNEVTTGSSFGDMQRYLRTLDRSKLQGIEATKQVMHDRAEAREAYAQLSALLNPVNPREKDPRPTGRHGHEVGAKAANDTIGEKILKMPALLGLDVAASMVHAAADAIGNLLAPANPKTIAELEEDYRLYQVAAEQSESAAAAAALRHVEREGVAAKREEQARIENTADEQHKRLRERERER